MTSTLKRNLKLQLVFFSIAFFSKTCLIALPFEKDSIYPLTSYIHYGEKEGLTSKTVYCVIQDKDGFIWVGTDAGVFRYDGKYFKQFTTEDGLSDNEVLKIYQDHSNRIWFLTFNGHLSFWNNGKICNSSNTPFLKEAYTGGTTRTFLEDKKGRIFIGTEKYGFIVIDKENVKTVEFKYWKTEDNPIYLYNDANDEIWAFRKKRMYKLLDKDFKDSIVNPGVGMRSTTYANNNDEMYFYSVDGIYKVSNTKFSLYIDSAFLPTYKRVSSIISEGENLWVCTSGEGCSVYEKGKFVKTYLKDLYITSVLRDRENNLWFGTIDQGIYMQPTTTPLVTNFNESTGLSGKKIISIASAKGGQVWLGYDNGTVDRISGFTKKSYELMKAGEQPYCRITSILIDSENVWCGTDVGIFLIQNQKMFYLPIETKRGDNDRYPVKRIFMGNDKTIYATTSFNLIKVGWKKNKYVIEYFMPNNLRTFAGIEYKNNLFLVSGMNGISEFIPGLGIRDFKTEFDFSSTRILDMKLDADRSLILATASSGIHVLNGPKSIQHISKENGLSDNCCNKIYINNNIMYVATANGLNILKKHQGNWKIIDRKTKQDGIPSNFVCDVTFQKDSIYVGTDEGLSIFSLSNILPTTQTYKIMVTEIVADTQHLFSGKNFTLNASTKRLVIKFAHPVFNPLNLKPIKYRLINNKDNNTPWDNSQNNEVEFSSLNPGNYIFQLKTDEKTESINNITSISLNIQPRWWQTLTAKIFFSLISISFIAFLIWKRTKTKYELRMKELRQKNLLETERNRIASDMHDDIGADLTHINMLANMAKVSNEKSVEVINKISSKSNEVLEKMDHIIWTLDSIHDHLPDLIYFIREQSARFLEDFNIALSFETDGEIPDYKIDSIKRRNISLVLKELIHNSAKHSNAKKISINVFLKKTELHFIYIDFGKGYNTDSVERGLGHTTLKSRMEEINSNIIISSKPGEGVNAHLVIPLN